MTETTAGATPVVPDATSGQSAGDTSGAAPATGAGDQLGDAGMAALKAERTAAKEALRRAEAAERKLAEIQAASQSDQEKALAAARKEGATEAASKADARVRRAEVRRALESAGCVDVEIAAMATDFAGLAVTEDGDVVDLDKALVAFRQAHATLFAAKAQGGRSFDQGTGGGTGGTLRTFTRDQIADPVFFEKNKAEILAARQRPGGITG